MRQLKDPRELSALAHPVRVAIIEQLSFEGPLTATELGERIGESPANCSWHLRKLAEFDFVEETGDGAGRRRPWRITQLGLSWDEDATPTPADEQVGLVVGEMLLERNLERLHRARVQAPSDAPEWREAMSVAQSASWLTVEELKDINDEIMAILMRHLDRMEDPSLRPEGARLVEWVAWGVPITLAGAQSGAAR